jgi:hypothetical protein
VSGKNVASKTPPLFSPLDHRDAALFYRQRQLAVLNRLRSFARLIGREPVLLMG